MEISMIKTTQSISTHRFEDGFIRFIVNPIPQWIVHSVVFTLSSTDILQEKQQMPPQSLTKAKRLLPVKWSQISPWGRLCQGSTLHTCERKLSWRGLWCRKPPPHRPHDGCQYLCTELSGGIWREKNEPFSPTTFDLACQKKHFVGLGKSSKIMHLLNQAQYHPLV